MKTGTYVVVIGLAAVVCGLAFALGVVSDRRRPSAARERERLEQTIADLYQRVYQAESQRESVSRRVKALQNAMAALAEERDEDRQVIKDLWTMLLASASREKKGRPQDEQASLSVKDKEEVAARDGGNETQYDVEAVKRMLVAAGGNLDTAVHQIVTPEGIRRTLLEHSGDPVYWVAAASLAADPQAALQYLEEATRLYPDSAPLLSALLGAQIAAGVIDESTLAYVSDLQSADPTNALGDCYAAYCQFQSGDVAGALYSLAQAGAKARFADDRIGMLMARYDYLRQEGAADPVALGLSAFTLPLDHLGMVRQIEDQSIEQVRSLSAAGQFDEALKIARDISNVGKTVSSSGRFLIHDRVGIALQQAGLAEQRQIYEALGDVRQVQEIDAQLQAVQDRSGTIDTMVLNFGTVLANMTAEDLAGYVDSTILNGEFATLQNIPEVAEALQQAQGTPQEAPAQTAAP